MVAMAPHLLVCIAIIGLSHIFGVGCYCFIRTKAMREAREMGKADIVPTPLLYIIMAFSGDWGAETEEFSEMKIFRLLTMLLLGIMLNVNLTSCSKEDNLPEKKDDTVEHPNGIPSNIPNNIIYYITSDDIIVRFENEDVFGGTQIVSNTYSSTKGYGTIVFASEVTAIEPMAFKSQTTLTYIVLPNSVTSIGYGAFTYCSGLTSVTIPNSVKSIKEEAFANCI